MSHVPLITQDVPLQELMERLKKESCLALDTEASSFHRYHERIGLIQLSDRTDTFLVDPLAVQDMAPLGVVLADADLEIVVHDADYDLRLLKRMYGFRVFKVFDTLIAAELLNEPGLSLAALLKKYFDIVLDKRYQKADWCKRPLTQPMLDYAAMDTRHLIALRDIMEEQLRLKERWEWAEEEFDLLTEAPFNLTVNDEPAFLRLKGAKTLKPHELAVLREVFLWREGVAEKQDRAPFMILGNDVLLSLATDPPRNRKDILQRKGVSERMLDRYGTAIMDAVQRGVALPKDEWPRVPKGKRWQRDDEYEHRFKRLKQVRDKLMVEHDLRPSIVAANLLLMEIARTLPGDLDTLAALPGIRRYQVKHFGEELLKAL